MTTHTLIAHNGFKVAIEAASLDEAFHKLDAMLVAGMNTGEPLWPEDFEPFTQDPDQ